MLYRIGTNIWPGYEPLHLAQEQGFLPKEKFKMVEFNSSTETIRAFRNKTIEAAALTIDEVLLLAQDGGEPVILLVLDHSNGGDAILVRKKIKSLKQLKGMKVGVEDSALGGYVLSRALDVAGLKSKDVTPVSIEISRQEEEFKNKKIDAVVTFDPVRANLVKLGAHVIFDSSQMPKEISDVLVVQSDVYKNNPRRTQQLKQAWLESLEYIQKNKEKAIELMAQRERITKQEFDSILSNVLFPTPQESQSLVQGSEPELLKSIDRIQSYMLEKGLLKTKIDTKKLFRN